jgi:hypothetical protein
MTKSLERPMNPDAMSEPRPRTFTIEECDRANKDGIPLEPPKTESVDEGIQPMPPVGEEHAFSLRTRNARRALCYHDCVEREADMLRYDNDPTVLEPGQVAVPPAFPDSGIEWW